MKFNWKNLRYSALRMTGMLAIGGAIFLASCSGERTESEYGDGPYSDDAPAANTTSGRAANNSTAGSTTGAATTSSTTGAAAPGGSTVQGSQQQETYGPEYGTTTGVAGSPVGRGGAEQGDVQQGGDMSESDTMPADKTTSATGAAGTGTGSTTGQGSGQGTSRTATTGSAGEGSGGTGSGTGISTPEHQRERAAETNRPRSDSSQNRKP